MSTPVCLKDSLSQCISDAVVDGLVRAAYEELILAHRWVCISYRSKHIFPYDFRSKAEIYLYVNEVFAVLYGWDVGQMNGLLVYLRTYGPLAHWSQDLTLKQNQSIHKYINVIAFAPLETFSDYISAASHLYIGLCVLTPHLRGLAGFAERLRHEARIAHRPRPLLHQLENKGELIKIRQYVTITPLKSVNYFSTSTRPTVLTINPGPLAEHLMRLRTHFRLNESCRTLSWHVFVPNSALDYNKCKAMRLKTLSNCISNDYCPYQTTLRLFSSAPRLINSLTVICSYCSHVPLLSSWQWFNTQWSCNTQ